MTDTWTAIWPAIGVELDARQEVACAARILAKTGFSENYAGHITSAADDAGNYWCTPWGLWWDEIRSSDVVLIDSDGELIAGDLGVTPAIYIHTGLHRFRADARVVVHNHPPYGTLLASHAIVPRIFTQTGLILHDDIRLVAEYTGAIGTLESGDEFAKDMVDGSAYLLANHGVITVGANVPEAVFRAVILETVCRQTYESSRLPSEPCAIPYEHTRSLQQLQIERSVRAYWDGAVRQLIRAEPDVLA